MKVVLSARREDRLRSLAAELDREFGAETCVVVADLAAPESAWLWPHELDAALRRVGRPRAHRLEPTASSPTASASQRTAAAPRRPALVDATRAGLRHAHA